MKNTKRLLAMVFALVFMFIVMIAGAVFADKDSDKGNGKSGAATEEKVKGNDKVKTEESITEDVDTDTEEDQPSAEKAALLTAKKQLKKTLADALPLDKVIAKGRSLKFDMPPIYKEGKVMVPVRALSAAYGADVQWNGETKGITITSLEGKIVVINMNIDPATNAPTVTVDGTPVVIAVKNVNGRVVLPVGFIAEQLGLKADVDEEDGTVEIDEVIDPLLNTQTAQ